MLLPGRNSLLRILMIRGNSQLKATTHLFCPARSYDVYKTYIDPKASGRRLLLVSRLAVLAFALFAGCVVHRSDPHRHQHQLALLRHRPARRLRLPAHLLPAHLERRPQGAAAQQAFHAPPALCMVAIIPAIVAVVN